MAIGKTLYVHKREDWRAWLEANFETAGEIWLVNPNTKPKQTPFDDCSLHSRD